MSHHSASQRVVDTSPAEFAQLLQYLSAPLPDRPTLRQATLWAKRVFGEADKMRMRQCDERLLYEYIDTAYPKVAAHFPHGTAQWPDWAGESLPEAARRYHVLHELETAMASGPFRIRRPEDHAQPPTLPSPATTRAIAQSLMPNWGPAIVPKRRKRKDAPRKIVPLVYAYGADAADTDAPDMMIAGPSSGRTTGQRLRLRRALSMPGLYTISPGNTPVRSSPAVAGPSTPTRPGANYTRRSFSANQEQFGSDRFPASRTLQALMTGEGLEVQGDDVDMENMPEQQRAHIRQLQSHLKLVESKILVLSARRERLEKLNDEE